MYAFGRDLVEAGADHGDLAIFHLVELHHAQILEGPGVFAAELDAHVGLAHPLALEGRAVGHRNRDLGHPHLDAPHLDGLLHQLFGPLQVVLALDGIEGQRDHMLVGGDARGQDFGDQRIGDDGEAKVDGPRGGGVLEVVHLAQGQDEGEDPVLVVEQDVPRLPALHAAEGERAAHGKAQRIDGADGVGAEGHDVGVVAHLHPFLLQLVDDAPPIHVAAQEGEDVAPLELADDLDGDGIRLRLPDDGGEARHAPVHQRNAPGAQLDVVDGAVQVAVVAVGRHVGAGEAGAGQVEAGKRLGLLAIGEAHGLDGLFRQQGGHAGVQRFAQVGRPAPFRRDRVEQGPGLFQHWLEVAQRIHLAPGHPQDQGQVVRRVGKGGRRLRAFFDQGLLQQRLRLGDDAVAPRMARVAMYRLI